MAKKFYVPIDLQKNELRNAVIGVLASAPSSPVEGQVYYDSTDDAFYGYANGGWRRLDLSSGGVTSDMIVNDTIVDADINSAAAIALSKLAVNPLARANHTGTQTAATVSDFDTQVRTSRLDQMAAPTAAVSLNGQKITNLDTPIADGDAATKAYVDAARSGLDVKQSVRVATTAAGTLATSFENGDTIDGVVLATGDRILIKDQAAGADNGIYVVAASGAPTRATDADVSAEVTSGMFTFVEEGTTNGDSGWVLSTNGAITLGTTALAFSKFSSSADLTAGDGLTKTGTTMNVEVNEASGLTVAADEVAIGTVPVANGGTGGTTAAAAKTNLGFTTKYSALIGDGAALTYNVDHNLGTTQVHVAAFIESSGEEIECDITRTTTNRVVAGFSVAPATNTIRIVVIG